MCPCRSSNGIVAKNFELIEAIKESYQTEVEAEHKTTWSIAKLLVKWTASTNRKKNIAYESENLCHQVCSSTKPYPKQADENRIENKKLKSFQIPFVTVCEMSNIINFIFHFLNVTLLG